MECKKSSVRPSSDCGCFMGDGYWGRHRVRVTPGHQYQFGKAGGHLLIFTALMKCLVRHFRAQVWSEVISEPRTQTQLAPLQPNYQ